MQTKARYSELSNQNKKLLLRLISLVGLCLSLLPVSAFAAGANDTSHAGFLSIVPPLAAIVIALVNWVQTARVIYTQTSSLAERDFIAAERTRGAGTGRILFHHILPHLVPTIIAWGTLGISTTVLLEATLSFLGVGVQPPTPSWGNIIFENQTYFQSAPWLVFIPGAAIILLALAFNLVGDALRDVLDPTQRGRD